MISYKEIEKYSYLQKKLNKDIKIRKIFYFILSIFYILASLFSYSPFVVFMMTIPISTYIINIKQLENVGIKGIKVNDISILLISYFSFIILGEPYIYCFFLFIFLIIIYSVSILSKFTKKGEWLTQIERNLKYPSQILEMIIYFILLSLGGLFALVNIAYNLRYNWLVFGDILFFMLLCIVTILTFYFALTFNVRRAYKKYLLENKYDPRVMNKLFLEYELQFSERLVDSKQMDYLENNIEVKQREQEVVLEDLYDKISENQAIADLKEQIKSLENKAEKLKVNINRASKKLGELEVENADLESKCQIGKDILVKEEHSLEELNERYGLQFHKNHIQRQRKLVFRLLIIALLLVITYQLIYITYNKRIHQDMIDQVVHDINRIDGEDFWSGEEIIASFIDDSNRKLSRADVNQVINMIELEPLVEMASTNNDLRVTDEQFMYLNFLETLRVALNDSYLYHYSIKDISYDGSCVTVIGRFRTSQYVIADEIYRPYSQYINDSERTSEIEFDAWVNLLDQALQQVNPQKYKQEGNIKNGISIVTEWSSRKDVINFIYNYFGVTDHLDWGTILLIVKADEQGIINLQKLYEFGSSYSIEEGVRKIDNILELQYSDNYYDLLNDWTDEEVKSTDSKETDNRFYVLRDLEDELFT